MVLTPKRSQTVTSIWHQSICNYHGDTLGLLGHIHNDAIKWKHSPLYWSFVRGIHRSPVNSPHKGQWCGALKFSLICVRTNGWANNRDAGDLRRRRAHYVVTVITRQPGPLFIKRQGVIPPNFLKFRSHEIGCYNDCITLKFDGHLGSAACQSSEWLEKP